MPRNWLGKLITVLLLLYRSCGNNREYIYIEREREKMRKTYQEEGNVGDRLLPLISHSQLYSFHRIAIESNNNNNNWKIREMPYIILEEMFNWFGTSKSLPCFVHIHQLYLHRILSRVGNVSEKGKTRGSEYIYISIIYTYRYCSLILHSPGNRSKSIYPIHLSCIACFGSHSSATCWGRWGRYCLLDR